MKDLLGLAAKYSSQKFLGKVQRVEPLEPDLSPRRYYRVHYQGGHFPSAMLMKLADGMGPLGGGPRDVSQSDAFVEVHQFFLENQVRVPAIFTDARSDDYLLLEDFGNRPLWQAIEQAKADKADPFLLRPNPEVDIVSDLMKKALLLLRSIQASLPNLAEGKPCLVFERQPTFEQLQKGPKEFEEYLLKPRGLTLQETEVCLEFIDNLAEEVRSHRKVPSHYDFTAHNIMVLADESLGIIDFQDACLESEARDLHAVLCDRGMDEILRVDLINPLFAEFSSSHPSPAAFKQSYYEYAVHWDMRVAGRFTKFAEIEGREKYKKWIPGTTKRVLLNLQRLTNRFNRAADLLEILERRVQEDPLK